MVFKLDSHPTSKQLDIKEYQGSKATGNILIHNVCTSVQNTLQLIDGWHVAYLRFNACLEYSDNEH